MEFSKTENVVGGHVLQETDLKLVSASEVATVRTLPAGQDRKSTWWAEEKLGRIVSEGNIARPSRTMAEGPSETLKLKPVLSTSLREEV
jgi:hypothetical protein